MVPISILRSQIRENITLVPTVIHIAAIYEKNQSCSQVFSATATGVNQPPSSPENIGYLLRHIELCMRSDNLTITYTRWGFEFNINVSNVSNMISTCIYKLRIFTHL